MKSGAINISQYAQWFQQFTDLLLYLSFVTAYCTNVEHIVPEWISLTSNDQSDTCGDEERTNAS